MKQALQLKLGQQLVLTPQLQQAIKLLQMSTIDLQQTIDETLESNALLEHDTDDSIESQDIDFYAATNADDDTQELDVDTTWEDAVPSAAPPQSSHPAAPHFPEQDPEEN